MPEIDFLNKKTFTKTSGMINLRKRATEPMKLFL